MAYGGIYGFLLGIMEPFFPYTFDPLFGPLLSVGSPVTGARLTVVVITAVVAVLYSIITYLLMDMEKYKRVKEEMKEIQDRMKKAQEDEEIGQSTEHMKESFGKQLEMMKARQKPMLVTFLLFFLVFPWLFATFSPIATLPADNGDYSGTLEFNGNSLPLTVQNESGTASLIVDGESYQAGENVMMGDLPWRVRSISTNGEAEVQFTSVIWTFPVNIPGTLSGEDNGWLVTYILLNIPITMFLSKKLGIQ